MISLRARAVTGGILWAGVVIILGLASLASFMTAQPQAQFTTILQTRHAQATVALVNNPTTPQNIENTITDPVYRIPGSGHYWQIENTARQIFTSQSLGDDLLPHPDGMDYDIVRRQFRGPDGDRLLAVAQWIALDDGSKWHIQVAASLTQLEQDQMGVRQNLLTAFAIIAAVGVLGALAQVAVVLQPLSVLRKDVLTRWDEEGGLSLAKYPVEVAPLVNDINSLLGRNRDIMRRSRRQAADLAHAIKTPSAIMRNELMMLKSKGADVGESITALDRLDAQLKRSFARMRADASEGDIGSVTEIDSALGRMKTAFTALAKNAGKTFTATYAPGLRLHMDQSDFEEIIGNLLDNALKWAQSQVALSAGTAENKTLMISIHDDGPGIAEDEMALATRSGQRLDVSKPGTGLGLAIASDLVHAYGGRIVLERSKTLGGLAVHLQLPMASARRTRAKTG